MKAWQKRKNIELGKQLGTWRTKAFNRFLSKIFTWLLSAFVFGILASIVLACFGLERYSLSVARIVFFISLLTGVFSSYIHHVVHGVEYIIYEQGLVHVKPTPKVISMFKTGSLITREFEVIPWSDIETIVRDDQKKNIVLDFKEGRGKTTLDAYPAIVFDKTSTTPKTGTGSWNPFVVDKEASVNMMKTIHTALKDAKRHNA